MKRLLIFTVTMIMITSLLLPSYISFAATEANYSDHIPNTAQKPDNFVSNPGTYETFTSNTGCAGTIVREKYDKDKIIGYLENSSEYGAEYGAGPNYISKHTASFEKGKSYVISARFKNGAPERKAIVQAGFSYAKGIGPVVTWDVANTEFETYSAAFTASVDGSSIYFGLSAAVDRTGVTDENRGLLLHDYSNGGSLYIAEETAYEITNTITGDTKISAGSSATLKTEVLNQVGIKGNLSQDVTYTVLNADRTAPADGITVTTGEDGQALVNAASSAKSGTYVVYAMSSYGIGMGAEIEVEAKESCVTEAAVAIDAGKAVFASAFAETPSSKKVMFALASYNTTEKKLMHAVSEVVTVEDGKAELMSELSVSISGADLVKIFVWDAESLAPVKFADSINSSWKLN